MGFNSVPLLATGDWIDAAWGNTYWRDNFAALYPYTAAGDLAYAVSAGGALARLAKPSVNSLLKNTSAGVPSWLAMTAIPGTLHAKNTVNFSPGGQTFSGSWADITSATLTLTLTVTCTVIVTAAVRGYNGTSGRMFYIRSMVDGVADGSPSVMANGYDVRNEALPYLYYATGVTAGSRIVKLQCQADTDPNYVESGRLMALAYVE